MAARRLGSGRISFPDPHRTSIHRLGSEVRHLGRTARRRAGGWL
jgi:hypothetical protein